MDMIAVVVLGLCCRAGDQCLRLQLKNSKCKSTDIPVLLPKHDHEQTQTKWFMFPNLTGG